MSPESRDEELDRYRKEASDLASAHRACDPAAVDRVRRFSEARPGEEVNAVYLSIEDARRVVALEAGFEAWADLVRTLGEGAANE